MENMEIVFSVIVTAIAISVIFFGVWSYKIIRPNVKRMYRRNQNEPR